MGCKSCKPCKAREQRRRNAEIDRQIAAQKLAAEREVKILLLGPGESGKSTVFKQMKIIQQNGGYSQKELMEYKYTIYGNVITQMKVIVTVAIKLNVALDSPENDDRAQRVAQVAAGGDSWTVQLAEDIMALWADNGIQRVYGMRDRKYHLNESAAYFFDNVTRIMQPDYIASYQDVLRARVRTTGIQEALFQFDNMRLRMLDVGGQRSERRKWIHCFSEFDTQILTNRGFLWMRDVLALVDWRPIDAPQRIGSAVVVTDWRGLTVATYCEKTSRLVYRTPNRLVVNADGSQRLVEFSSSDRISSFDCSGGAAAVSVVATNQHQLYARVNVDDRLPNGSFRKLTCDDLLRGKALADKTAALDDGERREQLGAIDSVTFMTAADAGVAAAFESCDSLSLEAYGRSLVGAARVDEWALTQLGKHSIRSIVAGWQAIAPGALFASSVEKRDDLVRLLMHGGYTTTFSFGFEAARAGWRVHFAERDAVDASVRLSGETSHVVRERRLCNDGRTWCFDMSSAPHKNDGFVVVRRVRRVTCERFEALSRSLEQQAASVAPLLQSGSDSKRLRVKTASFERELSEACSAANGAASRDCVVVSSSRPTIQGNCFDSVTCVLFVASISEYDQTLREGKENRMLESLALFDDICNSKWFQNTAFILFLNKTDLFKKKIAKIDMKDYCFPTYTGGADFDLACEFVKMRFFERNLSPHVIFGHFTMAISTEKFEFVFNAVRSTIISQVLERNDTA